MIELLATIGIPLAALIVSAGSLLYAAVSAKRNHHATQSALTSAAIARAKVEAIEVQFRRVESELAALKRLLLRGTVL